MIRCYIADRRLDLIERNSRNGVEYIQLREKEMCSRDMIALARAALLRMEGTPSKLLINTRADVAIACGAHGVHLPSRSPAVREWRRILPHHVIGVSCHTPEDLAAADGADFVFFSPVFDSPGKGAPIGIAGLAEAVRLSPVPVLALGGITWENAEECLRAGVAGIAGIRLFQS